MIRQGTRTQKSAIPSVKGFRNRLLAVVLCPASINVLPEHYTANTQLRFLICPPDPLSTYFLETKKPVPVLTRKLERGSVLHNTVFYCSSSVAHWLPLV